MIANRSHLQVLPRIMDVDTMELAYERHGTGPALVLLHGVGHRRQAWQPVLDLLTPHRTVIMVDLPGHGDSPPLRTAGLAGDPRHRR